ncbi:uncharacterized protein N7483_005605 [Penicillium malachiteum]|uniref:uncharacterized protein n=1 Tax=Penicillium malachiteum TaxID=1324776 RepID=UPI002548FBBB|nr:uncharacterized protein N7483_005605 [Penicillium malachiteum]KAJ5731097.1 hypothetical protein N7483_005605 [Penicillium malachiteum]
MEKRSIDFSPTRASKRPNPSNPIRGKPFRISDLKEGETFYQACILVSGDCGYSWDKADKNTYISVAVTDSLLCIEPSQAHIGHII